MEVHYEIRHDRSRTNDRNLAIQAIEKDHLVIGYDRATELVQPLAREGLEPAFSLDELVHKLDPPRIILIYVPHGKPTDQTILQLKDCIQELKGCLQQGDLIADGGNSHWRDSVRHYEELKALAFYRYRDPDSVAGKAVALLRHGFGDHTLHKKQSAVETELIGKEG